MSGSARRPFGVFGARVTMETRLFGVLSDQAEVIVPAPPDLDGARTHIQAIMRALADP